MAEITTGLRGLLRHPLVYETVQSLMGGSGSRKRFADTHIRAEPGDVVVDIGCGPAELLRHLPDVRYIGFDPNPHYVERAKRVFGARGTFHCKYFDAADAQTLPPVDVAVVSAVLHHMDDGQARELFDLLRQAVRPGGRVVSLDNVFIENQNPIARWLISMDRGRHVRGPGGYRELARHAFETVDATIEHKRFPPYTHFIMTAS